MDVLRNGRPTAAELANGVATVDVTSAGSLATLDVKHLDGLSLEPVVAAPTRLVLRLTRRFNLALPG
jgi:hypothetical protein